MLGHLVPDLTNQLLGWDMSVQVSYHFPIASLNEKKK